MGDLEAIIRQFNLAPHPEGGYYRETYRAQGRQDGRSFSTAIYYLLPRGQRSRLHRIRSDEVWHFYLGDPMTVAEITPDGRIHQTVLGGDFAAGQRLQHVVPAGNWFGAYPEPSSRFSLVGCTVAPGFEFKDLEMADRETLLTKYPAARNLILRLT